MEKILDRSIEDLSGGELQRFACAMVCIQNGDIFMFDEPSSYLDVKQRLKAAVTIRSLIRSDKLVLFGLHSIVVVDVYFSYYFRFVIVVEHDLSVLDYLSDFICCLYGVPGAYGVVTMPFSVREGNIRFFYSTYRTAFYATFHNFQELIYFWMDSYQLKTYVFAKKV